MTKAIKNLVNLGTKERPIMVPRAVVTGDGTPKEREWWEMLATGSIVIPPEVLDKLLLRSNNDPKS